MFAYNPKSIEAKWQKSWQESGVFEPQTDKSLPKKYILSMFPYPSGRIHMGHVRNYVLSDVLARYYRNRGYNVLHPIGWDSFGMPAENASIKHKVHPKKWTYENIDYMRKELDSLGLSFSKTREFATSDSDYSKFEQSFLIDMFEKGIIYRKKSSVNWCPHDLTVLANEQVVDGKCWRCDTEVVQKEMEQYSIKITDYAEELLRDLDQLEGEWPNQVLTMQRNWIGKSQGLEFRFAFDGASFNRLNGAFEGFDVYTTRPDTIYGVTYTAIAPEHAIVNYMMQNNLLDSATVDAIEKMKNSSEIDRAKHKEGVDLGLKVVHPLTKESVSVWVANFVLTSYGSGAVMSVPAHDERDFEFAKKYDLPIKYVIKPTAEALDETEAFIDAGVLFNSNSFDGLGSVEAKAKIIEHFAQNALGQAKTNYKLKDWGVSRQRYWGTPIPFIKCESCGIVPEKKENLPVTLPEDVVITGEGNPLEKHATWRETSCPKCGKPALRESDTLDTFVESSWYFLRYAMPKEQWESLAFDKAEIDYWMEVDQYIGGIEHAVMHLLYARFFTKVLRDLDYINITEPFKKLLTQGMVLKDGAKMSKSKGNVVDPDKIIAEYGADTARVFMMFAAPPTKELEWNDSALEGSFKFLKRLFLRAENVDKTTILPTIAHASLSKEEKEARFEVYDALVKSKEVYEKSFTYNTLIAAIMQALNALSNQKNRAVWTEGYWVLLNILEPIAPHIAHELSQMLFEGQNFGEIAVLEEVFVTSTITLAVQINGKRRCEIEVDANASKEEILTLAKESSVKWIEGKSVVKEIVVPNKLINIVVK